MSSLALEDPLVAELVAADDQLLWETKQALDQQGLDLKMILAQAHPVLRITPESLDWVDQPTEVITEPRPLPELLAELRAFGYHSVATMIQLLLDA